MFDWFKRHGRPQRGEYLYDEVTAMTKPTMGLNPVTHCDAEIRTRPWPAGPGPMPSASAGGFATGGHGRDSPCRSSRAKPPIPLCSIAASRVRTATCADDRPLGRAFQNRREILYGGWPRTRTLPWPYDDFAIDHSLWEDKRLGPGHRDHKYPQFDQVQSHQMNGSALWIINYHWTRTRIVAPQRGRKNIPRV